WVNSEIMPDHIVRVSVRIPDFCPTDPEMWFRMVERSFDASGITSETTKFGYLMSALDPRYALESSNSRSTIAEVSTVSPDGLLAVQFKRLATSLQQELAAVRSEIADIKNKSTFNDGCHYQRYRQRSRSRGRTQNSQEFCWHHWKFGTAAKKCKSPCSFVSVNSTG
ncbi:hypothetical protein CBL_21494, partial [Carabus blaptoides fortunei]